MRRAKILKILAEILFLVLIFLCPIYFILYVEYGGWENTALAYEYFIVRIRYCPQILNITDFGCHHWAEYEAHRLSQNCSALSEEEIFNLIWIYGHALDRIANLPDMGREWSILGILFFVLPLIICFILLVMVEYLYSLLEETEKRREKVDEEDTNST